MYENIPINSINDLLNVFKDKFKNEFEVIYKKNKDKYYCKQLRNIWFDTKEEVKLYAFLKYCSELNNSIERIKNS